MKHFIVLLISLIMSFSVLGDDFENSLNTQEAVQASTLHELLGVNEISFKFPASQNEQANIELASSCCKVCKKGKACGDSCISRSYSCTKPQGCACNGQ